MEQKTYQFPARREEIAACNDVNTIKEWENDFQSVLTQMDSDFGGIENVPEYLYKYAKANECNLKTIRYKLHKLTSNAELCAIVDARAATRRSRTRRSAVLKTK